MSISDDDDYEIALQSLNGYIERQRKLTSTSLPGHSNAKTEDADSASEAATSIKCG